MSLTSLDTESNNLGLVNQSPTCNSRSKPRSVWIQCHSEMQLKQELRRFLDDLYGAEISFDWNGKLPHSHHTLGKSLSQVSSLSSVSTMLIFIVN